MRTSVNGLVPSVTTSLRVFCFQTVTGWVCIDFKLLRAMPGWLYVVPAGHCIWGTAELLENCLCTEVKENLPEEAQHGLEQLVFAPQKRLSMPTTYLTSLEKETIIEALAKEHSVLPLAQQSFAQKRATLHLYHELADAFCRQIEKCAGSEKQLSVPQFAASLYQQERTLRRACLATYGMRPVEMLTYYKALLGAQLLVETDFKLADIADRLGFADESKCTRFFKGKMGMCPMDFRRRVRGLIG